MDNVTIPPKDFVGFQRKDDDSRRLGITDAAQPAHCTIFWDDNYNGARLDLYAPGDGNVWGWRSIGDWNDQISSIIVHSGFWVFYQDANFNLFNDGNPTGGFASPLGVGGYPSMPPVGILNDAISSIKGSSAPFNP